MAQVTEELHHFLLQFGNLLAVVIELLGVSLLVLCIAKEVRSIYKHKFQFTDILDDSVLDEGLSTVIEVFMAAELLKSLTSTDFQSLLMVGLLVIIRVFMSFALHWELSHKTKQLPSHHGLTIDVINHNEENESHSDKK